MSFAHSSNRRSMTLHDLHREVLEEFAEAQRKGRRIRRGGEFRSENGFQIHKGMLGACATCGLPMGQHAQWGCRGLQPVPERPHSPYDWSYEKYKAWKQKKAAKHGEGKEEASASK